MNLFRSEEHARRWPQFNPASEAGLGFIRLDDLAAFFATDARSQELMKTGEAPKSKVVDPPRPRNTRHLADDDGLFLSAVDAILAGEIDLVVNTPFGRGARSDGYAIRTAAVTRDIPYVTTQAGVLAAVQGIEALVQRGMEVESLQEYTGRLRGSGRRDPAHDGLGGAVS